MLVFTRRSQEAIVVGSVPDREPLLKVTVLEIQGNKARLGFQADDGVMIHRSEVWERPSKYTKQPRGK